VSSVLESPFALQVRTSLLSQKVVPAVQTTGAHAPATQTCICAAQSVTTVAVSPSAEQEMTFSPVVEQPIVPGWQIHGMHIPLPEEAWLHVSREGHGTGALQPLPTALHVETPFCWQRVELPTHTSRSHAPPLQNQLVGQSE
jgi:hypothetical protein